MKVILYMATTANGYIADNQDNTPWSQEEWKSFSQIVSKTKNIVIGRKTFELMNKSNEFSKIGNPFTVVVSKNKIENTNSVSSPEEAISLLEKNGFKEILITGGGLLNSSFMQKNLIDEIYLDIEPYIFGDGVKLFSENSFIKKLELMGTKLLGKNTIQLHYKVKNS